MTWCHNCSMASPTSSAIPQRPTRASGSHSYRYVSLEHSNPPAHADRLEWLKAIILKHQLYVPNVGQLNDPADGSPRFTLLSPPQFLSELFGPRHGVLRNNPGLSLDAQIAEAYVIDYNIQLHGAEKLQRRYKDIFDETMNQWKVYCLSKRYDNMNLWAKYADKHRGYCLEFANEGAFFACAMNVTYGEFAAMDVTNDEHININWFFSKGTQWSNEEEVRVLVPRQYPHEVIIDPRCLTRIILGRKMSDSDRAVIRDWAKQRQPELEVVTASWDSFENVLKVA